MVTTLQAFNIGKREFVILDRRQYTNLLKKLPLRHMNVRGDISLPPAPKKLASGNFPAAEALRADLARYLIKRRWAAQLTQAALARRAGIRVETLNRVERARVTPNPQTILKIVAALEKAEARPR